MRTLISSSRIWILFNSKGTFFSCFFYKVQILVFIESVKIVLHDICFIVGHLGTKRENWLFHLFVKKTVLTFESHILRFVLKSLWKYILLLLLLLLLFWVSVTFSNFVVVHYIFLFFCISWFFPIPEIR